jgi:hypothetical protein
MLGKIPPLLSCVFKHVTQSLWGWILHVKNGVGWEGNQAWLLNISCDGSSIKVLLSTLISYTWISYMQCRQPQLIPKETSKATDQWMMVCHTGKRFFFFWWYSWGSQFRALHLSDRHSTTWASPPAPFAFIIFQVGSQVFAWGQTQTSILLPMASCLAGMTGLHLPNPPPHQRIFY